MFYVMLDSKKEIEQVSGLTQVFKSWTGAYQDKHEVIDWAEPMINSWFELCVTEHEGNDIGPDMRMYFCADVEVIEKEGGFYLTNDTDVKSVRYFKQEYYKLSARDGVV